MTLQEAEKVVREVVAYVEQFVECVVFDAGYGEIRPAIIAPLNSVSSCA